MKKTYINIFTVLFLGISAFAQEKHIEDANWLFLERNYKEAAEIYLQIEDKNREVLQNLADSFYYLNRMEDAETYYEQLFQEFETEVQPEYKFRYAHTLRVLGEHEKADERFSEYFRRNIDFEAWKKKIDTITEYTYETRKQFEQETGSNFGVSFLADNKRVFASTRNQDRPEYNWNDLPYLDLFIADYNEGELSNIKPLPGEVNTDTHESSASFNQDGTVMYFDRTNSTHVKNKEEGTKVAYISIFRSELVDGEWTQGEALPFTSKEYTTEHPSLSADGTKLFFSSNMPGTMGSYDIFMVEVFEDGTFGDPQNLGPMINTPEREQFPFISNENVLYFSSNGRFGFGNLDLFSSQMKNEAFTEAKNLGPTINSSYDDFAYSMDEVGKKGFFTSTREGDENLFAFVRKRKPEPTIAPEEIVETNGKTGAQQLKDVDAIYFNFDEAVILPASEVALKKVIDIMKEYPKLEIEIGAHADIRGAADYNLRLSERRAQATLEYILDHGIATERISAKGYGETMPLNNCSVDLNNCTEKEHAINRRSEFKLMN